MSIKGSYALQSNATKVQTSAEVPLDSTLQAKPAAPPAASPAIDAPSQSDSSTVHPTLEEATSLEALFNSTVGDKTEVEAHPEDLEKTMFVHGLHELLLDLNKYLSDVRTAPVQLPVYLQSRAERLEATAQDHVSRHESQDHSDWVMFHIICQEMQATLTGGQKLRKQDILDTWADGASKHHGVVAKLLGLLYMEPVAKGVAMPQRQAHTILNRLETCLMLTFTKVPPLSLTSHSCLDEVKIHQCLHV